MLKYLLDNNQRWAEGIRRREPDFFTRLSEQQRPEYLWIGCSDSRVPANVIVGLQPGEIFVHRNIANLVIHSDLNCLSVIQYAVEILRVKHIIVCGHYGCGGIATALENRDHGLIDNWLRHLKDLYLHHRAQIDALHEEAARHERMCELNVLRQVNNVCVTNIVQRAWKAGQELAVHGWIYRIENGILKPLNVNVSAPQGVPEIFHIG